MREPVDFDAAWAEIEEASGPSPRIKVRGEVIDLPHSMPAKVALYTVRHRERLEGKAPDLEAVHELAGLLLGADRVARWVEDGMTMPALFAAYLLARNEIYGLRKESAGEAQPPETGGSSTTSSRWACGTSASRTWACRIR